jgi:cell division protein FtsB
MTESSARTMPVLSGDMAARRRRRSAPAGRRRALVLGASLLLLIVAVVANFGPLSHYQSARARLEKATAKVDILEAQKVELQGKVAKLSETGYLEALARGELTYVRPGEELYIVTEAGSGAAGSSTAGSATAGAGAVGASGDAAPGDAAPGFLERIVQAIRGLF